MAGFGPPFYFGENRMKSLLIIAAIIALIVGGPLATIWSLNTLFGLMIPYNLATWFATLWLGAFFTVKNTGSK